jgi:glycosyltransferase involved in cell wall biosynthesis
MKIALCHFRVGETDGVSLEMDKWKKALVQLGHEVVYIAGSDPHNEAIIIPELHYQHPLNNTIVKQAFEESSEKWSEEELKTQIYKLSDSIESALHKIIKEHQIDVLVPNNILSLGWGLSAGIAFTNAIRNSDVKAVCRHHDFHWERVLYSQPKFETVRNILNRYFPPADKKIKHLCINHIAQQELWNRFAINSEVIPNVFDFEEALMTKDDFNKDMRAAFGFSDDDIIVLQATRVVERKGIELAIDFVAELQKLTNEKVHLVLAGQSESEKYYRNIIKYSSQKQVSIKDISKRVAHQRSDSSKEKIYSLWDAYSMADMVSYPSLLEGWGNQFIEALVARLPILVYEYPVFKTDIKNYGFSVISLGDQHSKAQDLVKVDENRVKDAAKEALKHLSSPSFANEIANNNYQLAQAELSISKLQQLLKPIFNNG